MSTIHGMAVTLGVIALLATGCGEGGGTEDATNDAADAPTEASDPAAETGDPTEEPVACSPRLFILVDSSASMLDSWWTTLGVELDELLGSTAVSEIEFGLGHFPTDDNCAVDGLVLHPLPEANQANLEMVAERIFSPLTARGDGQCPLAYHPDAPSLLSYPPNRSQGRPRQRTGKYRNLLKISKKTSAISCREFFAPGAPLDLRPFTIEGAAGRGSSKTSGMFRSASLLVAAL